MKLFLTSIIVSLTFLTVFGQVDLLVHFPFDGDASDISGNGNTAIVYGADLCPDRFGEPNKAFRFNDASDRISIPQTSYNINNYDDITISFWFKRSAFNFDAYNPHMIFLGYLSNYTICLDAEFAYGVPSPQYKDKFIFYNYSDAASFDITTHPTAVEDTDWHLFTAVVNQADSKVQFYLDGVGSGISSFTHNYVAYDVLTIGNHTNFDWGFIGDMDDIRIYSKALTQAEITSLVTTESISPTVISFFPNPCDKDIVLSIEPNTADKIKIYSITGQKVLTTALPENNTISVANLPSGVYVMDISNKGKRIQSKKFVIIRELMTP